MKNKTLATSPTIEGIERHINAYWYSVGYRVDPTTLKITRGERTLSQYTVLRYKNGFKFVRLPEP